MAHCTAVTISRDQRSELNSEANLVHLGESSKNPCARRHFFICVSKAIEKVKMREMIRYKAHMRVGRAAFLVYRYKLI
jgi:hypothetical protein